MARQKVLVFEDLETDWELIRQALRKVGYEPERAPDRASFFKRAPYTDFAFILIDLFEGPAAPENRTGLDLTREVHAANRDIPIVVMSSLEPSRRDVADAFRAGACDYIDKQVLFADPLAAIGRAKEMAENADDLRLEAELPMPMAFLYRNFRRSHTSPKRRLEKMIELYEVSLKLVSFSLLAAHGVRASTLLPAEVRDALSRPSLGHFLATINGLPEPPGFVAQLWRAATRPRFKTLTQEFTALRNNFLGHGVGQPEPVYVGLLNENEPKLLELLQILSVLRRWSFVVPLKTQFPEEGYEYEMKTFRGSNPEVFVGKVETALELRPGKHVFLVNGVDGAWWEKVDLFPWAQYLECPKPCFQEKLFLYRLAREGQVSLYDHVYGHSMETREGFKNVRALVAEVGKSAPPPQPPITPKASSATASTASAAAVPGVAARGPAAAAPPPPRRLVEAYRKGELVVFVGSGLSMAKDVKGEFPGYLGRSKDGEALAFPSWHEVPDRLLKACVYYERIQPRLVAEEGASIAGPMALEAMLDKLQLYKSYLARDYAQALSDIFRPKAPSPGVAHTLAVKRLNPRAVLTTNVDELLELVDGAESACYTWHEASRVLADLKDRRKVIFKVHGTARDPGSVVLTTDEYRRAHSDPSFQAVLRYLLQESTFLFIGYGMNDPLGLDLAFQGNAAAFKEATRRHYVLLKDPSDADVRHLENDYNVTTLGYGDHEEVSTFLEVLAAAQ